MKSILILMVVLITGCSSTTKTTEQTTQQVTEQAVSTYEVLSVADFKAKMDNLTEYHLVDVRTSGEVAAGTIENSTNIDYNGANFSEALGKLDNTKPLMLFCRSGGRSGKASQIAKKLGFTEIYDLKGGFMAWSAK